MITLDEARTRPTLTVAEAAVLARVGLRQMYEAVRRDEVPVVRLGRRILVKTGPFLVHLGTEPQAAAQAARPDPQPLVVDQLIEALQSIRAQVYSQGAPPSPYNAEEPAWQGELPATTTTAAVTKPSQTSSSSLGPAVEPCHVLGAASGARP